MLTAFLVATAMLGGAEPQAAGSPDVDISLERTACFGTCPVYSVRITGDGDVEYVGRQYVRVLGTAGRRISHAGVRALIDTIERAGYFEMDREYRYLIGPNGIRGVVTDLPTTTTSVRIGNRRHSVVDYVGAPETLHEVERAIDRAAGTVKWISVDRQVVEGFVRSGWNAASSDGVKYLSEAVGRGDADTVDALLTAGVDPNSPAPGALAYAHDPDVVRRLIDGGADVNGVGGRGETVLMMAVRLGDADKVRALIDSGALATPSNEAGETALQIARAALATARTAPPQVPSPFGPEPSRDYARIVQLLLAAGARDPR